jgi:hypothetical protein
VTEQFPPDEFDEIAKRGGPVGVHRAPRPWWSRLLAPVLIFLIAGAAAYLVANYMWNQEVDTPDEPTPTIAETIQSTVTPSPEPTNSAQPSSEPSPSPEPSETAVVEFDAAIAVLNGSGISGLAGKQETILEDAGFTDVTAANLTVAKPDANVVVYTSEDLKATAQEVAKQLGIDLISLDVTQTEAVVEVHLVTDPS